MFKKIVSGVLKKRGGFIMISLVIYLVVGVVMAQLGVLAMAHDLELHNDDRSPEIQFNGEYDDSGHYQIELVNTYSVVYFNTDIEVTYDGQTTQWAGDTREGSRALESGSPHTVDVSNSTDDTIIVTVDHPDYSKSEIEFNIER